MNKATGLKVTGSKVAAGALVSALVWCGSAVGEQAPPELPEGHAGIAARFPGDVGIEEHPSVVFVEQFEQPTLEELFERWEQARNPEQMSFTDDVPAGSGGGQSLLMHRTTYGSPSLYRRIENDEGGYGYDHIFVRYYVKFHPESGGFSHGPATIGGLNPSSPMPLGGAGTPPDGTDRIYTAVEPFGNSWRWDFYTYWTDMRGSPPRGQTWGNTFIRNPDLRVERGEWICIEHMVKMNDVGEWNGEQAAWINGELVSHVGPGFPSGLWVFDKFNPGQGGTSEYWNRETNERETRQVPEGGEPFEGYRWRTTEELNINYLWFYIYAHEEAMAWYDHIVVATEYIGPIAEGEAE